MDAGEDSVQNSDIKPYRGRLNEASVHMRQEPKVLISSVLKVVQIIPYLRKKVQNERHEPDLGNLLWSHINLHISIPYFYSNFLIDLVSQ